MSPLVPRPYIRTASTAEGTVPLHRRTDTCRRMNPIPSLVPTALDGANITEAADRADVTHPSTAARAHKDAVAPTQPSHDAKSQVTAPPPVTVWPSPPSPPQGGNPPSEEATP
ncbi:hypothetical protein [Streptomyces lushanensis]|uniref:hypothetical protein n=1 Tax=Streptomyces lushanensis TaxID=1434255 RepID=UPI00082B2B40|nr:hypothetical protein [Streptomyces lushanensis]